MNKSFEYWKNRQNQLESELIEIRKIIKEICPHDNIKYIQGSKDFHSTQWWVYPAYQCEDCEVYGSSSPSASKISQEIFKKFDRKYQERDWLWQ